MFDCKQIIEKTPGQHCIPNIQGILLYLVFLASTRVLLGDEQVSLVLGLVVLWAALSLCSSALPPTLPTFLSSPLC